MKFRKKPVVIDAVQWTGRNFEEIVAFTASAGPPGTIGQDFMKDELEIPTLEGEMIASMGDWIIKGIKGEFYPCKPAIFDASYEKVEH